MQERQEEYQANITNNTAAFQEVKKKITQIVVLRIFVFAATCFGCYLFSYNAGIAISTGVFGALSFVFMVQYHSKLDRKKNYFEELISINEIEIEALNGNIDNLENGAEFLNSNHHYSYDIDLFGDGSFFQFFNRTKTLGGRKKLAEILVSNEIDNIENKQAAIKELAKSSKERQHFWASAGTIKTETTSKTVEDWLKNYKTFASINSFPF